MKTEQDINDKLTRCPRLGDEITFSYCLNESGDLPCSRIMHCWSPFFDVESVLTKKLAPKKLKTFMHSKSKDKVTSLIELIESAKAKK